MQNGENERSVDGLAATGGILQGQLGLAEVHYCFIEIFPLDAFMAFLVEMDEFVLELI
jgi:hypothetical protein